MDKQQKVTVVVKVGGGLVQGVVTNASNIDVVICDYDIDPADHTTSVPEQDGTLDDANVYFEVPLVDAAYAERLLLCVASNQG